MKYNNDQTPAVRADNTNTPRAHHTDADMLRAIRIASLICMIAAPLLVDGLLRAVNVYIDTYIAVFYPITAVTVLQWMLYYLLLILTYVYQCASYGILGYSVLRYGVKRSAVPIILILISATVSYASGIIEFLYLAGTTTVKSNLAYYLSYWALNYFLSLFTCLCLIFLCAMLRVAFQRKKRTAKQSFRDNPGAYTAGQQLPDGNARLQVGITDEDAAARKTNVLRRLYLWMTGLLFAFRFLPGIMNMITEIGSVGAPHDIWDWITLLQPFAELALLSAMGYFVMVYVGSRLTDRSNVLRDKTQNQP